MMALIDTLMLGKEGKVGCACVLCFGKRGEGDGWINDALYYGWFCYFVFSCAGVLGRLMRPE